MGTQLAPWSDCNIWDSKEHAPWVLQRKLCRSSIRACARLWLLCLTPPEKYRCASTMLYLSSHRQSMLPGRLFLTNSLDISSTSPADRMDFYLIHVGSARGHSLVMVNTTILHLLRVSCGSCLSSGCSYLCLHRSIAPGFQNQSLLWHQCGEIPQHTHWLLAPTVITMHSELLPSSCWFGPKMVFRSNLQANLNSKRVSVSYNHLTWVQQFEGTLKPRSSFPTTHLRKLSFFSKNSALHCW